MNNREGVPGEGNGDELRSFYEMFPGLNEELDQRIANFEPIGQEAQFAFVRANLFAALQRQDVFRVIDAMESNEEALFKKFTSRWQERKLEQIQWSREGIHDKTEGQLMFECLREYYDEREFEEVMMNGATIMTCMQRYPDDWSEVPIDLETSKRELQAVFITCYGRGQDDEWYKFFDQHVPGQSLRLDNAEDAPFIEAAWQTKVEHDATKVKRDRVFHETCEIAGADPDAGNAPDAIVAASILIEMRVIAEMPIETEADRVTRNAVLLQFARLLEREDHVLHDLVTYFDACYPLRGDDDDNLNLFD